MTVKKEFQDRYSLLFEAYMTHPEEQYLAQTAELGRDMVQAGLPPEDIAEIHQRALERWAGNLSDKAFLEATGYVFAPLLETLMAYGLAFREWLEVRERAEQALRSERDRLKSLMEGLDEADIGIDIVSTDYRILYQNHALAKRFGESVGKLCYEVYRDLDKPCRICPMLKAIKSRHPQSVELTAADGRQYEVLSAPMAGPDGAVDRAIEIVRDITDRKQAEEQLKKTAKELKAEREELAEKNLVLRYILEHIEQERQEYKQQICQDVEKAVFPVLQQLQEKMEPPHARELAVLQRELKTILDRDVDMFRQRYAELTPREQEICELIKENLSSKEIADTLNISLLTVQKHRQDIRKKLGITNQDVNLTTYLRSR
ncbi:MAG: phosphatase RsbU N-terminal domain-containing protein [Candidatus Zixiibacteriota bacterium]